MNHAQRQLLSPSEELELQEVYCEVPERQLRKAILDRAICDYLEVVIIERHIVRDATAWLFHESKRVSKHSEDYWPLSFLEICDDLDLDPEKIRLFITVGKERFHKEIKKDSRTSSEALESISQLLAISRNELALSLGE